MNLAGCETEEDNSDLEAEKVLLSIEQRSPAIAL